jgi:hypothetical protein
MPYVSSEFADATRLTPQRLRVEVAKWMQSQRHLTHHVTLATNWDNSVQRRASAPRFSHDRVKIDLACANLRGWSARVDRELCGRNWLKRPDERLMGFAFLEHIETNIHWHGLLSLAPGKDERKFREVSAAKWAKLVPGGDVEIQPIDRLAPLAWYDTKGQGDHRAFDNMQMLGTLN